MIGIKDMVMRAENFTPTEESQVGMWIGAAVALHMSEGGIVEGRTGSPDGG